jgi:DNA-binding SARP family transcriptional activator
MLYAHRPTCSWTPTSFDRLGDHGQVARTYQHCVQALQNELNVRPSPETLQLYNSIIED